MAKLEHYIGTEIVDEIVETINNKLCHMKSDIQHELELQKIQIEETCVKVGKLAEDHEQTGLVGYDSVEAGMMCLFLWKFGNYIFFKVITLCSGKGSLFPFGMRVASVP